MHDAHRWYVYMYMQREMERNKATHRDRSVCGRVPILGLFVQMVVDVGGCSVRACESEMMYLHYDHVRYHVPIAGQA